MKTRHEDGVGIDVCPKCGGVWVERNELAAARKLGARTRLMRGMPQAHKLTSRANRTLDRVVEVIASLLTALEKLPGVDPRSYLPRRRPRP